jgi:trigger factor
MNILSSKKENNTVTVEFESSPKDFENALERTYQSQKAKILIPGFRKGKAPRKVIEKNYGDTVFYEDAVNSLLQQEAPKAAKELELDVIEIANPKVKKADKESGVSFQVEFTVKPEASIKDYLGFTVKDENRDVTDDDVERQLKDMQMKTARLIDASHRPVWQGDIIKLDFKGYIDGEAFEGGEAKNFDVEVGRGQFIPGFEEQIVGKNVGEEFEINVTFPADYASKEIQGKNAVFNCIVHSVKERELAPIDDEFAKDVSEFDTLAELKEDLKKSLVKALNEKKEKDFDFAVTEKLIELTQVDIPEVMFERRTDELIREWDLNRPLGSNVEQFLKKSGMTYEAFSKQFYETARKQVRLRFGLEKIAQLENISATDDDVKNEFEMLSKKHNMSIDKIKKIVREDAVIEDVVCEKALNLVKEKAVVERV